MSTATAQRDQLVAEAIREISHIATLPEITLKIVELVEDPKSTAQELHKVIANDPALCSRILKVVNSAFYGLPGQIGSINRAIVMLGLNAVKNIAIAASLAKLFRGGELTPSFSARSLWLHSVATATASKLLADELGHAVSDEAFLAGLIHDIGLMVEMQYDRNKLIETVRLLNADKNGVPAADMLEAERTIFGATHQDFGMGLCEKWKFPRNLALVAGHHHDPLALPGDSRNMPAIIYIADHIAAEAAQGFRLDIVQTSVAPEVRDLLELTNEQLEAIKTKLPEHLKTVEAMLS